MPLIRMLIAKAKLITNKQMVLKPGFLSFFRNKKIKYREAIYPKAKGISLRLFHECPINLGEMSKRNSVRIPVR